MSESLDTSEALPRGLLRPELYVGQLSSVSAQSVKFNLNDAGSPSGAHFLGGRYGKGEVGEFVLIEGQINLLLGRVVEIHLPDSDRRLIDSSHAKVSGLDCIGTIQLLGSIAMDTLRLSAGVDSYRAIKQDFGRVVGNAQFWIQAADSNLLRATRRSSRWKCAP